METTKGVPSLETERYLNKYLYRRSLQCRLTFFPFFHSPINYSCIVLQKHTTNPHGGAHLRSNAGCLLRQSQQSHPSLLDPRGKVLVHKVTEITAKKLEALKTPVFFEDKHKVESPCRQHPPSRHRLLFLSSSFY